MINLVENKKARFDFELLEIYEAGIELLGFEVKSIKNHRMNLDGSYVFPRCGEFFLVGATIAPYQVKNTPKDYEPTRERKLLLHKKEIDYLLGKISQKGLTILPTRVYSKAGRIKLEIALSRKFKRHDKRERTKERESRRKIDRILKEL